MKDYVNVKRPLGKKKKMLPTKHDRCFMALGIPAFMLLVLAMAYMGIPV